VAHIACFRRRALSDASERECAGAALCVCTAGCPVSQEIEDNVLPTASGDGLQCGVENVTSTFEVESVGQQGDLAVTVVGMHCLHSRPCL